MGLVCGCAHSHTHTHAWIDMFQPAGPMQDRGLESIDSLPIRLRADPRATFILIPPMRPEEEAAKCHTCFLQSP